MVSRSCAPNQPSTRYSQLYTIGDHIHFNRDSGAQRRTTLACDIEFELKAAVSIRLSAPLVKDARVEIRQLAKMPILAENDMIRQYTDQFPEVSIANELARTVLRYKFEIALTSTSFGCIKFSSLTCDFGYRCKLEISFSNASVLSVGRRFRTQFARFD